MSYDDGRADLAIRLGRTTAQRDWLLRLLRQCLRNPDLLATDSMLRSNVEDALAEYQENSHD